MLCQLFKGDPEVKIHSQDFQPQHKHHHKLTAKLTCKWLLRD
jgi:hypothetical protein